MSSYKFNVRVYGILIQDQKVLVTEESVEGLQLVKFPGGGLEFGEGTIDCLKREFMEELGLTIKATEHFYTTDFFQPSAFGDAQVLSVYYRVHTHTPIEQLQNLMENERSYWLPLQDVYEGYFTLPIDRIVGKMLQEEWAKQNA